MRWDGAFQLISAFVTQRWSFQGSSGASQDQWSMFGQTGGEWWTDAAAGTQLTGFVVLSVTTNRETIPGCRLLVCNIINIIKI